MASRMSVVQLFKATAAVFGLFLIALLMGAPSMSAQVLYGSMVGNVTDPSGAGVPDVTITIRQAATNLSRQAITNEAGLYSFATVPAGTYELQAAKPGFGGFTRREIEVTINSISRVDMTLQVGAVSESVQVSAQAGALQTDRSEVRAEVTQRQLENLPVPPGRNYQALFKLIPGMSPPSNVNTAVADPSRSLVVNANGGSRSSNNYRIDGAGVNSVWLPHNAAYVPALESIESFNVVTNSFDAEQGLAGGSASNVLIKSGSNSLHGSAFEFNTNNAIKARPFFLPAGQRKPKAVFNQFGGTVGGAIRKDRLFYFVSYEGTTDHRSAAAFATVLTAAMRRGDLSRSPTLVYDPKTGAADGTGRTAFAGNQIPPERLDPIAQKILGLLPQPTFPDLLSSNLLTVGGYTFDRHKMDSKVNWNASDKFSLFARVSFVRYTLATDSVFGEPVQGPPVVTSAGSPGTAFGTNYNSALGGTYIVSPNFVVDGNFGYTLMDTNQAPPGLDKNAGRDFLGIPGTNGTRQFEGGWPRFVIANYTNLGIDAANRPIFWHDPRFQYTGNANWTRGSHNIRFGTDLSRQHLNHTQPEFVGQLQGAAGGFNFSGGLTSLRGGASPNQFNSAADFLLGLPVSSGRTLIVPDNGFTTRAWLTSLYVRDQWQASRKLTISYGTRWEYFPMPTRSDRGLERYDPATNKMLVCGAGPVPTDCGVSQSKTLFAPRFGIAYRATDTFVLRAGYGISIDPYSLARPMRTNFPVVVVLNVTSPSTFQAVGALKDGIPAIATPVVNNGMADIPGNIAANTLSDHFPRGYIQSWNFTIQKEVAGGFVAQGAYVATRQVRQTGFLELNAGLPGGGVASEPLNQKFKRTASTPLVTSIGNSHYDALQLSVERRFSKGLQVQSSYTFAKSIGICCNDDSDGNVAIPLADYYRLNRAVSSFDRTHNFQFAGIYELPFGKSKPWAHSRLASAILGGWQLNGIFSKYSGLPFSVSSSNVSLNAPGSTQRADQVKPDVRILGGTGPGQSWFDPLAFAPVTAARFGTAGFNTVRGPGLTNLDVGLFREFRVRERFAIQFRAEAFNFTNTPHFALPGANVSNLQLNADNSIRNLGGFTSITSTTGVGRDGIDERVFQFGAKISF